MMSIESNLPLRAGQVFISESTRAYRSYILLYIVREVSDIGEMDDFSSDHQSPWQSMKYVCYVSNEDTWTLSSTALYFSHSAICEFLYDHDCICIDIGATTWVSEI